MAYGPHAVARHDGLVLFVRGAAPGERVEVRIHERRRNLAFAEVTRIERRSGERVPPACPIVERCGGCPWQHLSYASQIAAKRKIVADHLARIAGVVVDVAPVLPSPRVYGYRRRIKLRAEDRRLGYYAGGSHDLVDVDHCALAESEIDAGLADARRLTEALSSRLRRLEIVATHGGGGGLAMAGEVEGEWIASDEAVCRRWLAESSLCTGLSLRGRRWERRWGSMDIVVQPQPDVRLEIDATAFSQVNPLANRMLVDAVLRMAGDVAGRPVLEAYAGAGNFSAALVDRGAVLTAVEQSPASCRSARHNAAARGTGRGWRVEQGRVEQVLQEHAARQAPFDLILLDPPRSGAAAAVPAILSLHPARLIYVSCDPATLARDLARLATRYRIAEVQPVDMFPHTYHVETVVLCTLG